MTDIQMECPVTRLTESSSQQEKMVSVVKRIKPTEEKKEVTPVHTVTWQNSVQNFVANQGFQEPISMPYMQSYGSIDNGNWRSRYELIKQWRTIQIPESYEYLSDYLSGEFRRWRKGDFIFINAPVGSGKTTFLEHMCGFYRALVLTNRTANWEALNQRLREKYGNNSVTVCTYQSLCNSGITSEDWDNVYDLVVCDEYQLFLSDSRFAILNQIVFTKIMNIQKAIRVFVSATGEAMNQVIFHRLLCYYKMSDQELLYRCIFYVKRYSNQRIRDVYGFSDDETVCVYISKDKGKKTFLFVDTKSRAERIKKLLEANKIKCMMMSTETKGQTRHDKLIRSECIPEDIQVVLATIVCDSGVNVRNIDRVIIYLNDPDLIIQCLGRARFENGSDHQIDVLLYDDDKDKLQNMLSSLFMQLRYYREALKEVISKRVDADFINLLKDPANEHNNWQETVYYINKINGIGLEFNWLGYVQLQNQIRNIRELLESPCPAFHKFKWLLPSLRQPPRFIYLNGSCKTEISIEEKEEDIEDIIKKSTVARFLEVVKPWIGIVFTDDSDEEREKRDAIRVMVNDLLIDFFPRRLNMRKKKLRSFQSLNQDFQQYQIPLFFQHLDGKKKVQLITVKENAL